MSERDIFTAARAGSDPAARVVYLAEACGGDTELRQRVERLLRADDSPDSLLDVPAVAAVDRSPAEPRAFEPNTLADIPPEEDSEDEALSFLEPPGRADSLGRLGHYEVLEVLGKGGFGIVFRAFDDTLQRVVAVKVLAPLMAATSPARKRFLREARSSAQVRHENVVKVHAVEDTPLTAEGIEDLQQLPALEYLNLSLVPCTSQHVAALARLKINQLIVASTGIDDSMAARLAPMENLTSLSLPRNPLTDKGLAEFKKLKRLKNLDVSVTEVTATGVADLQKALPDCKIQRE